MYTFKKQFVVEKVEMQWFDPSSWKALKTERKRQSKDIRCTAHISQVGYSLSSRKEWSAYLTYSKSQAEVLGIPFGEDVLNKIITGTFTQLDPRKIKYLHLEMKGFKQLKVTHAIQRELAFERGTYGGRFSYTCLLAMEFPRLNTLLLNHRFHLVSYLTKAEYEILSKLPAPLGFNVSFDSAPVRSEKDLDYNKAEQWE